MANEYIAKDYKGSSQQTTLSNAYTTANTSIVVADGSSFPAGGSGAYFVIVISRGLADEEKMLISSRTGNTLTIVEKGYDGTTSQNHAASSTVNHCLDAYTLLQANRYVNLQATKGDLVARSASTTVTMPVGTNTYALVADSATTNGIAWQQIVAGGIATDAVTTVKIQNSAVTSAKIADGTIVNADINASAGIDLSKLATTGTMTATTFVGALTGNASTATSATSATSATTAATVTTAAQPAITSVGSLNGLAITNATAITGNGGSLNFGTYPDLSVYFGSNSAYGNTNLMFNNANVVSVGAGNMLVYGYVTATAYYTSSDHRLKENITEIDNAIERIKQLRPVKFQFKDSADDVVHEGFLAHEIQGIAPYAVRGEKDAVTEDGNIEPQTIDMSKLVGLLTAGIKELDARLTQLETN